MNIYFTVWAATFVALLIAIVVTALIYKSMGDGLDLNGWVQEVITALVVSAGQASGYLLEQHFPIPRTYQFRIHGGFSVSATIFVICLWLGYKITHLTTWDQLEYVILLIVDGCLAFFALIVLT